MSEKPKWKKWQGQSRGEFEIELATWERGQRKPACRKCKYWVRHPTKALFGECCRFPSMVETTELHWCGEFGGNGK